MSNYNNTYNQPYQQPGYGQPNNNLANQAYDNTNIINQMQRARSGQLGGGYQHDMENMQNNQNFKNNPDLYQSSRNSFIKKVYTILSIQLAITALICVWAMKSQSFKSIFATTPSIIILSVLLMVLSIVVACCT